MFKTKGLKSKAGTIARQPCSSTDYEYPTGSKKATSIKRKKEAIVPKTKQA